MVTAACSGESGGRRAGTFPHVLLRLLQAASLCALALLALHVPRAQATTLWHCKGDNGEAVFSTSRAGYHDCRRMHVDGVSATPSHVTAPSDGKAVHGWQYRQGTAKQAPKLPDAARAGSKARVLRGAVYRVVHADGSIEYTNVRPRGSRAHAAHVRTLFTYIATCMACNVHSSIDWAHVPLRLNRYAKAIHSAAAEYGVDAALLRAVIHAESGFNPRAVSAKGAQGLMQLMPGTASDMGVNDAFDAAQNIQGGARYLAQLLKTFKGDDRLVAAAYNAGPDAVQKYGGVPPYAETEVYVKRVTILRKRYHQALLQARTVASSTPSHAD